MRDMIAANENSPITYGSVCSGIEAVSVAVNGMNWKALWFAEIEPFPCAVLAHHWPHAPNLGDMTKIAEQVANDNAPAPDVLVGGTPCQAFSVAGAREGLADGRGFLTIKFVELADEIDAKRRSAGNEPCVVWWENVPGVLSSKDNAFGSFLGLLAGENCALLPPGGKWTNAGCVLGPERAVAWRVLDAQYFGLAQRRRRVFVVASAREGVDPAKILFEFDGLRRDTAPSREAGSVVAALTANGIGTCGADDNQGQARYLIAAFGQNNTSGPVHVSHALNAHSGPYGRLDFESETFLVQAVHGTQDPDTNTELAHTLGRNQGQENAVAIPAIALQTDVTPKASEELAFTLKLPSSSGGGQPAAAMTPDMAVRRLTPAECERLQGFPKHKINVTISVNNDGECDDLCSDHPKKSVRVGTKNPKLLRYALNVGGSELPSNARSVGLNFKRDQERPSEHVAAHALIDLERMHLQILNAGKSILSASIADAKNQSPLPIPSEDFARVAALMMQQAVKITATGRAELPGNATHFSHQESGRMLSKLYGQEISELASDVGLFTRLVSEHLKFITSQAGRNSLSSEQMFSISSCFVAAAISGFIPEQTRKSDLFTLSVTISHGHTNIPVNGKPAADGPRYKAIGNSMATKVMRWQAIRIERELRRLGVSFHA